ncbi:hypothetical protein FB451DRAFT_307493 [Mycena latifolia]|nr:hypothetical protein FB451DRAFT_307493 [Mycena latifolia]
MASLATPAAFAQKSQFAVAPLTQSPAVSQELSQEPRKPLNEISEKSSRVQEHADQVKLFQLVAKFKTYRTLGSENHGFDTSMVRNFVPEKPTETYCSAALLQHDRHHGVKYYLPSLSSQFPFPMYPSIDAEATEGLVLLPAKYSFESKLFGWDKDDPPLFDPPAPPPPSPWTLPIADAAFMINPRSLLLAIPPTTRKPATVPSPADILAGFVDPLLFEDFDPPAAPPKSASRPRMGLPPRVAQLRGVPSRPPASAQPAPDYSTAPGSGKKRKAVDPLAARAPKKAQPARLLEASNQPSKPRPLVCGIGQCPDTFADKASLLQHQQLHVHAHHRFRCTGCPAGFAQLEDLNVHAALNMSCRSENAPRILQMFYSNPKVVAMNPENMRQNDLMAFWRQFVQAVVNHYSSNSRVMIPGT